ncbi:MAG: Methyltransferase type 11 [Gemmatimonadetes bacterium]|nr:Methyltransferase type 11 [Gemmatimonadota bacterium]
MTTPMAERDARPNMDRDVVQGFGDEWSRFDQSALTGDEYAEVFDDYFHIFPWESLSPEAEGFDLGCGSGRWARNVAPRVGRLHCVDASADALHVAERNLSGCVNVQFHCASVDRLPFPDASMDFGYCLGVLHHIPDTEGGLQRATAKLKRGSPFLLYIYYAMDNKPAWYRGVWKASEMVRHVVSRSPLRLRYILSQLLAIVVYLPLARLAKLGDRLGMDVRSFPLAVYRNRSFYVMRTDALDRFGTRLEQRFSRAQIGAMMTRAGLADIRFSERAPFWCAMGRKV